jgi:ribosomal protein L19E
VGERRAKESALGKRRGADERRGIHPAAMEEKRVYFVRIAGVVRGPLTSEDLRDLTGAEVVTRESEIALAAGGPWAR